MNIYKVTFQTKDICEGFTAIVSRWQIVCAENSADAIGLIENKWSNLEPNIQVEKR